MLRATLIALGIIALLAEQAEACSCGWTADVFPDNGAADVPRNVVIRGTNESETVELLLDGGVVPTTFQRFESGGGQPDWIMRPNEPLAPNTTYTIRTTNQQASFATGDGTDTDPPTAPRIVEDRWHRTPWNPLSSCEPQSSRFIKLEGAADGQSQAVWFNVYGANSEGDIDLSMPVALMHRPMEAFGNSGCVRTMSESLASGPLVFRAVDLAGNESEATNAAPNGSCGCSASSVSTLAAFAAIALLFRRRSRT